MSTNLTTLWRHQPCSTLFSFNVEARPDRLPDDCDVCGTTDNRWVFDRVQQDGQDLDPAGQ